MGRFNNNNNFNNKSRRGGPGRRGGFDRDKKEMFDAVCDNCGKDCQVPFRPTQGKPIFCSNCFEEKGGNSKNDRGPRKGRNFDNGGRKSREFRAADNNLAFEMTELKNKLDSIEKTLAHMSSLLEDIKFKPKMVRVVKEKKKKKEKENKEEEVSDTKE